jgi:uncharacterized protein
MDRIYLKLIKKHFAKNRQMVFLSGPRQVGKTTTAALLASDRATSWYWNWDVEEDRALILSGSRAIAEKMQLRPQMGELPLVVFDEIHKYPRWKNFLKGFFDLYEKQLQVLVTGSARLDLYKRGSDSLMGRYFPYRLHPLTVGEVATTEWVLGELREKPIAIDDASMNALTLFGGFPEPFLKRDEEFYRNWSRLRTEQLFREDLRDLTRIHDITQMRLFAELLWYQAGQTTSYSELAKKAQISVDTVRRWLEILQSFYFCFALRPWSKNLSRALIKEPKIYLWDWSYVQDAGARLENLVACHLHKAVHYWTDRGLGDYGLYYLRTKEQREVDFIVIKNGKPWFMVEVKTKAQPISSALYWFQQALKVPHAFQLAFDLPFDATDCFSRTEPTVVSARAFLSQLP